MKKKPIAQIKQEDSKIPEIYNSGCFLLSCYYIACDYTGKDMTHAELNQLYEYLYKNGYIKKDCYLNLRSEKIIQEILIYLFGIKRTVIKTATFYTLNDKKHDESTKLTNTILSESDYRIYKIRTINDNEHFRLFEYDPSKTAAFYCLLGIFYYDIIDESLQSE